MKRKIKAGDYFLMPFAGKRIDLLVTAVRELPGFGPGQWEVRHENSGRLSTIFLPSCHRCLPSVAARILPPTPDRVTTP
jgi:hypothetical protein